MVREAAKRIIIMLDPT
uniref:Uncharacterized protein n=1 Tax=Arundo donax TaxID=35708 RepID=A0A0A9AZT5_ARUDO